MYACLILKPPFKVTKVSRGRLAWYSAGLESPWEQSLASSNLALGAIGFFEEGGIKRAMSSPLPKKISIHFCTCYNFTLGIYISYTQNPECPQSESASQCWDFRPLLITAFSFLTLILIFSSLYKYRILNNEN